MADFVNSLLTFPPEKTVTAKEYDKLAVDYVKNLKKAQENHWTKSVGKQNVLDLLNPAVNSLPYLFALIAQWNAAGKDRSRHEEIFDRSVVFFSSFEPIQVRYAGEEFRTLLEKAFEVYPALSAQDFSPLCIAMLRLDPTGGTYTSNHLRFVRLCLANGVPSQALPILDKDIYAFPQTIPKSLPEEPLCEDYELSNNFITANSGFSMPIRSEYVLEYYLLGAHVYIGQRNYSRARLFLEYTILMPSSNGTCSALQVEGYKKWIMLGLLEQGKSYPLPRTHSQVVMKSLKSMAKNYDALADDFEKRDFAKYQAEMEKGMHLWLEDGNAGLVQEVGNALMRYRIIDLQKTYAALPVSKVAKHLDLSANATLRMLSDILREGQLNASITPAASSNAGDAVLHFDFTASSQPDHDIEAQAKRIEALTTYIRDADRRLQLTKEYVDFTKRSKRGAAGPDGDLAEQMDLSWDPPIAEVDEDGDEEDIMAP